MDQSSFQISIKYFLLLCQESWITSWTQNPLPLVEAHHHWDLSDKPMKRSDDGQLQKVQEQTLEPVLRFQH